MKLLDVFAMVAMHAYIRSPQNDWGPDDIARESYDVAYEMMKLKGDYDD